MCVAAQRRLLIMLLLVAGGFACSAVGAAIPATQSAANDISFMSGVNLSDDSYFTDGLDLSNESGRSSTASPGAPPSDPAKAPTSINDPLPPAFWSGLSMLAICAVFISVRKIRYELLR
jgi:hypothetical protein